MRVRVRVRVRFQVRVGLGLGLANPNPNPIRNPTLTLLKQIQFSEHDVLIVVGHSHFFRTMFQARGRERVSVSPHHVPGGG